MSELDSLMVDELRREFRRTRPPAKALQSQYCAGIFRLTEPTRTGYRIFWYPADALISSCFSIGITHFELIEPLPL